MNIILKGFDGQYCKEILSEALKGLPIDTCICPTNNLDQMPTLNIKNIIWEDATAQRNGDYSKTDWNTITPIDEELIEKMRPTEAVFLSMIERYTKKQDISYEERRAQYMQHLRYWNHMIETHSINLYLANNVPHQCFDLVIYDLCHLKNIAVRYIERFGIIDACCIESDWNRAGENIRNRYNELKKEYQDIHKNIPLTDAFNEYFNSYTTTDVKPWYAATRDKKLAEKSFVIKWTGTCVKMLIKHPWRVVLQVVQPSFWARKLRQHRTSIAYDSYVVDVDLNVPFVYLPLHFQPEASTCPMAGVFNDQYLMAQMLGACAPDGLLIYVKEHPFQGETCRSEEFYKALHNIPQVRMVPRGLSTFELNKHSLAIATATGTAGFEGFFRQKPVIMFGHRFYQFAPGIFRVETIEQCAAALQSIMNGCTVASLHQVKLFVKAMEEETSTYPGGPKSVHCNETEEQRARKLGRYIHTHIKSLV